jgi:methylenetetrahydrofolate reductase (NADPH)
MSRLQEALDNGEFVVTSEVGPPKGASLDLCLKEAEMLRDHVTAINVTDLQSAIMRVGSLAVSARLVERGLEPVFQLTCRDRNRLALQSDLLSAWVLGIQNVLALTGDHTALGDHAEAKPVYDLDSVQLLQAASALNEGFDMTGHELESAPALFMGAAVTPAAEPLEPQIIKMKKKIDAGARFFQTQAVFDPDSFERFMDEVHGFGVPVIAGILVLKSAAMARFMNESVAGVTVPESMIEAMEATAKEDRKKRAADMTAAIIRQIRPYCQGVHIMPVGWDDLVPEIVAEAGLA